LFCIKIVNYKTDICQFGLLAWNSRVMCVFLCMVGIVAAQMQEVCCFIVFHFYRAENKSPASILNASLNAFYRSNVASLFFHLKGQVSHVTQYGDHGTEAIEASVVCLLIYRSVIPQRFCTSSTSQNIAFLYFVY
jgi:hypothetical protein